LNEVTSIILSIKVFVSLEMRYFYFKLLNHCYRRKKDWMSGSGAGGEEAGVKERENLARNISGNNEGKEGIFNFNFYGNARLALN
jgi:hypothetical protein